MHIISYLGTFSLHICIIFDTLFMHINPGSNNNTINFVLNKVCEQSGLLYYCSSIV